MPAAKKSAPRSSRAGKEPAALKQLMKSLDGAQDALAKLRTGLGKDVSGASKTLHKDLERFVKQARRDSGKLGTALQRDLAAATKKVAARTTPTKSTTRKPAARKPAARKPAARKPAAK